MQKFSPLPLNFRFPLPLVGGAVALLCAFALPARADDLHLRDGRVVSGKVTRDGSDYVVAYETGAIIRFPEIEVVKLDKVLTVRERYDNLRAVCDPISAKAQFELGKWCQQSNLPDEARLHFKRAVELDPNHAAARKAAGFVLDNGVWLSKEAAMTKQGKALYKGEWLPVDEAQRKLEEDDRLKQRADGSAQASRILGALMKDGSTARKREAEEKLRAMGEGALGAVIRLAGDPNPDIREVCLTILGGADAQHVLKELFNRLRYESEPELVKYAVRQLVQHPDRERVMKQTLDLCVHSPARVTRQRTWLVLRGAQDMRVIPALIELAEFNPVPPDELKDAAKEKEKKVEGWVTSNDAKPKRNPYYPATEALNYLTGANIFPMQKEWSKWWAKNSGTFQFKPLPGMGEKAEDDKN